MEDGELWNRESMRMGAKEDAVGWNPFVVSAFLHAARGNMGRHRVGAADDALERDDVGNV